MQHRQTISQTQLCALLWASLLAPAAELLPAVTLPWAGKAAWLTTLLAFPVLAAVGWVLSHAAWRRDGLPQIIRAGRSEERRVGKECRSRWSPYH